MADGWLRDVLIASFVCFLSLSRSGFVKGYPTANKDIGTFWQITDIHWDDHYSQKGDPNHMCHILINETGIFNNGIYGNFDCDSPWILVKSAIQAMEQYESNPDFIIWTGDNSPHIWNPAPNVKAISQILSNVTRLLSSTFPNATVLPVIGNHDTFPPDTVSPGNNSFYNTFLTAGRWNEVLPNTAWETFLKGGYYIVDLHPGLKLIGLNTILWYGSNKLTANSSDPGQQFSWLESNLETAKKNNEKVYIIGHVPPGHSNRGFHDKVNPPLYHEVFNKRYVSVVNKFSDAIAGQFFAHLHYDTFGLFFDQEKIISSMLLAPSITPWHSNYPSLKGISVSPNPSVRLYHYDRTNGRILNYEQYFLNLTKVNSENRNESKPQKEDYGNETSHERAPSNWELLYSFADTYNLSDVSASSLFDLSKQLLKSQDTFKMFYNFTSVAKNNGPCDIFCKKMHLCAIVYVDQESYTNCIKLNHPFTEETPAPDVHTYAAVTMVTPHLPDKNHSSSGSSRNILIGCTLSLLVIIMILVVVYIKRTRLAKGPRFVRFQ